ncbi:MAG: PAS domain S-box protein [Candidatus Heimdallarchaeota archaeon]|nr:MAG: PAS domain S-box protein [Candidatus Heimdallarchaeota archaeon]
MELETILDRPDVPTDVKEAIESYLAKQKHIEEAKHEIGLQLRQTLDSMGDAIHVVGPDLRFMLFNTAFKQWNKELGLPEDVIGQRLTDVFPFLSERIIGEYNHVFSTGEPIVTEERTTIGDEEFFTETRKIPIVVEGKVTRVVTVVRNITDYKQTITALQESEEKYRNLVERANDGIAIVQDSLIKYVNPSLAKMTGYTAEELYNTPILNYIHPEVLSEVMNRYEQRMAGQSVPPIYETIILLKNNKTLEVEINAAIITYQGKPADFAIIRDITERKQVEQALRESEEKYRTILEDIEEGYYEVDLEGRFTFFNNSLCTIFRYSPQEIMGMSYKQYCDDKTASIVFKAFNEVYRTGKASKEFDWEVIRKDGSKGYVEASVSLIFDSKGERIGFRGIVRDITERKQVEYSLRESEEKYRTILENIEDAYYEVDLSGNLTFFNDALCKILGYPREELMGMNNREYTDEETAKMVYKNFNRVYRTGKPTKIFAYEIIRKNGAKRVNEASVSLITDSKGTPTGFRGIVRDITERQEVEQALRESEARYRRLIELSPDAITLTDLNFNIIAVNQQAVEMSGASIAEELIGKNTMELIAPEDRILAIENAQKTLQRGMISNYEYNLLKLDGTLYPAELSAGLITDVNGDPFAFISIARDITERKIAEMELRAKSNAIDSSINAINISDLDGKLTYVNTSFLKMWGFSDKSDVIGKSVTEFTSTPEIFINLRELLLREGSWMGELTAKKRDGSLIPIQISISLIKSESGEPHSLFASMIDMTDRKKAEEALKESEQKFRVISERTMMGICILQDDVIKYANQSFADIFEYSIDEILNWKPGESAKVVHPDDRSFVTEQRRKKQLGEKDIVTNYSYKSITKTGQLKWIDNYSKTITYMGKTAALVSIIDITERKQAEQALKESKDKYKMLVEKLQEGVALEDDRGVLTFVNPRIAELLGYTEDELIGKHWSYIVPKEYIDQVKVETAKRPTGVSSTYEACTLTKDGRYIPVIVTATPVFSSTGKFDGVLTVFTDITDRKLAEQKVHESAEKYRTILETVEEGYYEVDISGNFTFFNDSICKILGYSNVELIGMNYRQYMDDETAKRVFQTYNTVYRTGEPARIFDFGFIRKDGTRGVSEASISPMRNPEGEIIGFRGVVRDVTERAEIEKALTEERERFQSLVEKLEEGLTVEDPDGFITFANPKTLETLGYSEDELLGKHWSFIVPENDLDQSYLETAKRSKGISSAYESNVLAKDGTSIPVIVSAAPIFSSTGDYQGVLVLSTDITDRKRVEEELQQSEEKYSNLFHYSNDAIFLHDLEGNIIDINEKTLELFGYTNSELLSIPIPSLHPPESLETSKTAFEKISKEGFVKFEIDFRKKSGEVFPAEVSSSLFEIRGKKVIQGIVRDITERKRAEQALMQVKLEEERYHAMMSHFINNDMQKIINNLELLSLMYESKLELDRNIVDNVIEIASGSSKTIDTVNKIYEVLQSPFIKPKNSLPLINIINGVVSKLSRFSKLININRHSFTVSIFTDAHLKDVFNEILFFILSYYPDSEDIRTTIDIEGSLLPTSFCVVISDCCSEPLPQEIISKLSGTITDEWEIIGHNIGIALASVILHYYGGSLEIHSLDPKGNEFKLLFPLSLIENPREIHTD